MVGANHAGYTSRFHELAKSVPHLVTPESSRIKRYIAGLAPEIRGMLRATQPTTIQSAILRAGILTDKAVSCGTLTKGNEKIKGVEKTSKQGASNSGSGTLPGKLLPTLRKIIRLSLPEVGLPSKVRKTVFLTSRWGQGTRMPTANTEATKDGFIPPCCSYSIIVINPESNVAPVVTSSS
ncbi:hypothetical protein Tco_0627674 [Tanacetum coccineum]|uniref:Reverse transcriptase domain-containing protein n=1 Tax=Tanacetum coccineum TaxID=301880 RepID=A0ABQ4WN93_9ASTR